MQVGIFFHARDDDMDDTAELITPDRAVVFRSLDAAKRLRLDLTGKSIADLKKMLVKVGERLPKPVNLKRVDRFRIVVLLLSMELSKRGVAPRWQGLIKWQHGDAPNVSAGSPNAILARAIQYDAPLYDLYWLWSRFCKNISPSIPKWAAVFSSDKFDLDRALAIVKVQKSNARKVRILGLSEWQQVGCIALIRSTAREAVEAGTGGFEQVYERELRQLANVPRMTDRKRQESARHRAQVWLSAMMLSKLDGLSGRMGRFPYQRVADVHLMVWGTEVKRDSVRKSMDRMYWRSRKSLGFS